MDGHRQVPIAIVGMGAILPGAPDLAAFWRCIVEGQDLIGDVPPHRWLVEDFYDPDPLAPDRTYCNRGAFLPEVDFDPTAYGIPPNALSATDTTQLLALLVAEATLADVGELSGVDRERVSVILGAAQLDLAFHMSQRLERPVWRTALRGIGLPESQVTIACDAIADHYVPWQEATFPGLLGNVVAGRIANRFDLHGTNCCVDAACASSMAALSMGIDELAQGRSDLVLTGGVDTMSGPFMYLCFSKTPALSATGDCRPFSDAADGTMLGEGLAMFALARLADAEAAGMRVHAVIRGVGSSSDGRGGAIYAPVPAGQARALRRAYETAGYGPETVELVEAHGTGTAAGDAAEFAALQEVFDATGREDRQWCALGSVKSQIGHTKCAAGAVGLLKAVLALEAKVLPATIKVDRPDPTLDLAGSPLYVNTRARPWIAMPDHPRRAAVSSFGFGGANFHVTVEEYAGEGSARRPRAVPTELLLASGRSLQELHARLEGDDPAGADLGTLARRSQAEFDPVEPVRLAIVASSVTDLRAKLDRAVAMGERSLSTPDGIHLVVGPGTADRVGLLFPGQGAQYVGMGADLTLHLPVAQATWDAAAAVDPGLAAVVFPPPVFTEAARDDQERRLTATEWAQPALAVTSLVLLDILRVLGVRADGVAGHSFGELVALHAAGVFDAPALLGLSRRRGELTRDAAAGVAGAMLAVLADPTQVDITGIEDVWFANYNGPAEVVLSGTVEGITAAESRLTDRGLTVRRLNTATAFHSPIVAPAVTPLREYLAGVSVSSPELPVFGNADAAPYPIDVDAIRDRLAAQLATPVRFADTIEAMHDAGIRTFVEVGAGAVLTGMVDRALAGAEHCAVALDRRGVNGLTRLQHSLGQLAVLGVPLDFAAFWDGPIAAPEITPKPKMVKRIGGGNYGRPYPPPGGAAALPAPNPEPVVPSTAKPPTSPEPPADPGPPAHPEWARATTTPPPSAYGIGNAQPALAQPESAQPESAPPEAAPPDAAQPDGEWLWMIEQSQRHVAQAHEVYQRALADGHIAFLKMAETSFAAMAANGGRADERSSIESDLASDPTAPTYGSPAPAIPFGPAAERPVAERPVAEWPVAEWMQQPAPLAMPRPVIGIDADPVGDPVGGPTAPTTRAELVALLLSIVADRTGYPLDVLGASMDLETDLGVDSIKRVEILAALRGHLPDLETLVAAGSEQATALVKLRTVDAIVDQLGTALAPAAAVLTPRAVAAAGFTASAPAGGTTDSGGSRVVPEGDLTRRVVRARPAPPAGSTLPGFGAGPVVITRDGGGVADALAHLLGERGVAATVVAEIVEAEIVEAEIVGEARSIILLEGLDEIGSVEDALALQRKAFRSARTVATAMERDGGTFVTVQDTGGDFGLRGGDPDRAWLGGLAALARTAAREWPRAAVKAIDCERLGRDATTMADAIVTELYTGGSTLDVGLSATGTRITLEEIGVPAPPAGPTPDVDGVLVVTGGARGVTAAAVRAYAAHGRTRFVLLGRTELVPEADELAGANDEAALLGLLARPGAAPADAKAQAQAVLAVREVRQTLADLAHMGAAVRYLPVDVTDRAGLGVALDGVREDWGPITGIVHGAGVLADRRIAEKTDAQFDAVFGTKVDGLRALLEATASDPLRLIVGFGSVAARFGNAGQCDYAMANETNTQVLVAEAIRRPDCLVRSLLWGPWAGGMVDESLAAHFRQNGVPLIPLERGADAFCAELAVGPGPVPVLLAARGALSSTVHVSNRTHPELVDHAPLDVPVLPVALVLDWFSGAARQWCPSEAPAVLRDLRVLRRVALPALAADGHALEIRGLRPVPGDGLLNLELHGDGAPGPHYRATVAAVGTGTRSGSINSSWPSPPGPPPVTGTYDGHVLFHGPRFQAIRSVDGVSAAGAVGMVAGVADLGWTAGPWNLDPAAVDGGLQLAVLWAQEVLGAASLPMAVAECRLHQFGAVGGPVRCVVRAGPVRGDDADCDIALLESDGNPVVELLGVTLVSRPR